VDNRLGLTGQSEGLWKSESDFGPGLGLLGGVGTLLHGFSNYFSLKTQQVNLLRTKRTLHLPVSSFIYS